ncbi:hypothetical protein E2553_35090 [Paraburkholderia dipogonis]|uniref:Uncharacterized protein n=1 Tax=Paraburkholderia dipogonis TaxID=1211383 RepID=A0A4Y8MWZ1_9BURK|nr:hypothetical protein [Paraburkholderia dipogonis]TFE41868.1 hypothetical protein E2553_35090 [Paraburkholderia dipogonis]
MMVRELIALLQRADPDSVVLFLDDYADLSEADELFDVIIPEHAWTYERGSCGGEEYSARYPDEFEPRDESYTDVTHDRERVVLITNGPTNYRRINLPERGV